MKQQFINIPYTEDILLSLKLNKEQFEKDARFLLAMKLYEMEKISSGKAAKLAGIDRISFLMKLKNYNISPFQVDLEEIFEEADRL